MRRALLLSSVSALLLTGCAYGPFHRNRSYNEDGTGVGRKLVVEKRPKSVLVAFDQTVCMVDAKRYDEVHLRDAVWCNWRREGGSDVASAPSGSLSPTKAEPLAAGAVRPVKPTVHRPPSPPRKAKKKTSD